MTAAEPLLEVSGLKTYFRLRRRGLWSPPALLRAVDDVDFAIPAGRTFGLVGESGSGKSTMALSVLRLVTPTAGRILFEGRDLLALPEPALRSLRKDMQIIFQDPYSSLNPRLRAGEIVAAPLAIHRLGTAHERAARAAELLQLVGLRPDQASLFPHQFSGGQRQRIAIARALASQPRLVVCDEPVSALDVAIQAQVLNLLRRLQHEFRLTYLFISHDFSVIRFMCDEIGVMYLGKIVERAPREKLFERPLHPYTRALLASVPSRGSGPGAAPLKGEPPSPITPPAGCRFAGRCPHATLLCRAEAPPLRRFGDHFVACHLVSDDGRPPGEDAAGAGRA
jgi:peptide/nickel transport system ATP-binding protein